MNQRYTRSGVLSSGITAFCYLHNLTASRANINCAGCRYYRRFSAAAPASHPAARRRFLAAVPACAETISQGGAVIRQRLALSILLRAVLLLLSSFLRSFLLLCARSFPAAVSQPVWHCLSFCGGF